MIFLERRLVGLSFWGGQQVSSMPNMPEDGTPKNAKPLKTVDEFKLAIEEANNQRDKAKSLALQAQYKGFLKNRNNLASKVNTNARQNTPTQANTSEDNLIRDRITEYYTANPNQMQAISQKPNHPDYRKVMQILRSANPIAPSFEVPAQSKVVPVVPANPNTNLQKTTNNPQEIASWQKAAAQGSVAAINALKAKGLDVSDYAPPQQKATIPNPIAPSFEVPAQSKVVPVAHEKKKIDKPKKIEQKPEKKKTIIAQPEKKEDFSDIDQKLKNDPSFQKAIKNMARVEVVNGTTSGIKIIQNGSMKPPFMMTQSNAYSYLFQNTNPQKLVRYILQVQNS